MRGTKSASKKKLKTITNIGASLKKEASMARLRKAIMSRKLKSAKSAEDKEMEGVETKSAEAKEMEGMETKSAKSSKASTVLTTKADPRGDYDYSKSFKENIENALKRAKSSSKKPNSTKEDVIKAFREKQGK